MEFLHAVICLLIGYLIGATLTWIWLNREPPLPDWVRKHFPDE